MTLHIATLLAIAGMALASFGCRYGGYWLFRRFRPPSLVRAMLGYVPGALFVSYVAPALLAGGAGQWAGAAATLAIMAAWRNLSSAVLGGTAVGWAFWALY